MPTTAQLNNSESHSTPQICGGPGIVISASQTEDNIPTAAKSFIAKYFTHATIAKCTENFIKQTYNIVLTNGINITFNHNGVVRDIHMPNETTIPPDLLTAILPAKTITHLQQCGAVNKVYALKNAGTKGFGLALLNNTPPQMIFDIDGTFITVAQ